MAAARKELPKIKKFLQLSQRLASHFLQPSPSSLLGLYGLDGANNSFKLALRLYETRYSKPDIRKMFRKHRSVLDSDEQAKKILPESAILVYIYIYIYIYISYPNFNIFACFSAFLGAEHAFGTPLAHRHPSSNNCWEGHVAPALPPPPRARQYSIFYYKAWILRLTSLVKYMSTVSGHYKWINSLSAIKLEFD